MESVSLQGIFLLRKTRVVVCFENLPSPWVPGFSPISHNFWFLVVFFAGVFGPPRAPFCVSRWYGSLLGQVLASPVFLACMNSFWLKECPLVVSFSPILLFLGVGFPTKIRGRFFFPAVDASTVLVRHR